MYILGGSCIYSGTLHNLTLAIQIFNKIPFKSYLKFNFGFKTRTLIHRQMPEKLLWAEREECRLHCSCVLVGIHLILTFFKLVFHLCHLHLKLLSHNSFLWRKVCDSKESKMVFSSASLRGKTGKIHLCRELNS